MVSELYENLHPNKDRTLENLEGLWVLVVDDNEDSLELVRIILEEYRIKVVTAASAREAIQVMTQVKPDIMISDIAMPSEDGYWLIRQIRGLPDEQGGSIPAIALTACVAPDERLRSLEAGFQIYLSKPVDPYKLVEVVATLARTKLC
jgi:CheY-like chemotaxis protein